MRYLVRSAAALAMLVALIACRESEQGRLDDARQRATMLTTVARSDVVQSLVTSREPGRIIYDKPIDLSYATVLRTRPDLTGQRHARDQGDAAVRAPRDSV
jgi:hypothetical protein